MSRRSDLTREKSRRNDPGERYNRNLWRGSSRPVRGPAVSYNEIADTVVGSVDPAPERVRWVSRLQEYQARACRTWGQRAKIASSGGEL